MTEQEIRHRPIGVVRSPFVAQAGTPIQGIFAPDTEGTVEVLEQFEEGLKDIELFTHLYLVYHLDRAGSPALTCTPYLDDTPRGVFATRSPCRPNGLGLSIVRLVRREGRTLHVSELDILDGTPLLDIKPFVPRFDARPDAGNGWVPEGAHPRKSEGADDRFTLS